MARADHRALGSVPPIAPIAAPFAAPLALGWCWVSVGADVVGAVCAGGVWAGGVVCASAAGTIAPESAIRRDITLTECFIMASFWVLSSDPECGSSEAIFYYLVILCISVRLLFMPIRQADSDG